MNSIACGVRDRIGRIWLATKTTMMIMLIFRVPHCAFWPRYYSIIDIYSLICVVCSECKRHFVYNFSKILFKRYNNTHQYSLWVQRIWCAKLIKIVTKTIIKRHIFCVRFAYLPNLSAISLAILFIEPWVHRRTESHTWFWKIEMQIENQCSCKKATKPTTTHNHWKHFTLSKYESLEKKTRNRKSKRSRRTMYDYWYAYRRHNKR